MAEDTRVGTQLAGYRIEEVIGRGGMSVVYLAEHARLERKVALKVLAPELAGSERFHDRFLRESKLAASLDHPNIVPIYDADEADGVLYIAMRYVEGSDLKQTIRDSGRLDPLRTSAIVDQVASALDAAHARGLVHRDVKPANVLLTSDDHVYVSDFGLTKRAVSVSGLTETGQLIGTIDYVAPEQIKGDPVDQRADVYSLGCLLFECLTGHAPYPRDIEVGVLWAHVETPPPSLTGERPDLPPEVDEVVALAMAKDPAERTSAAGEVATGFRSALGLEAPPVGLPRVRRPRAKPKEPRRRTVIGGVVAGVALLAAAGILLLMSGGGAGDAVPSANSLVRIDASTNASVATMQVGEDPTDIAIGEDGDVWVINQGDSTVNRIDPETGEVTPAKSTLGIPTGIAAGEGAVWITNGFGGPNGTGQVVRLDPTNGSVEPAFASRNAKAIVVAFGSIWLADADRDVVLRYDPEDLDAAPIEIPTDEDANASAGPRSISAGTGAAEGIWVANELGDTVIRIDPETDGVTDRLPVESPFAVAADDSGVWVTSELNDRVHLFDPAGGRGVRTFDSADGIPDGPTAIAIAAGGVWVGSDLETAIVRIDPAASAIDRVPLAGITGGLTVDANGDVWVTVRTQQV
jgi:serine/threonine protein kinase/streptogramin lyase